MFYIDFWLFEKETGREYEIHIIEEFGENASVLVKMSDCSSC